MKIRHTLQRLERSLTFEKERPQMNGHSESTAKASALSSDFVRRVTQYQAAGINARLKLFALLEAQGVSAAETDDLMATLEAGAQCEVVELDGMAPASSGLGFEDGWDEGVMAVSAALVGIADRDWSRRGGRSAGAAELPVHLADVRQRERTDLARLEKFVRGAVLLRTHPNTTERRRVGGWRLAGGSIWSDAGAACYPHAAV